MPQLSPTRATSLRATSLRAAELSTRSPRPSTNGAPMTRERSEPRLPSSSRPRDFGRPRPSGDASAAAAVAAVAPMALGPDRRSAEELHAMVSTADCLRRPRWVGRHRQPWLLESRLESGRLQGSAGTAAAGTAAPALSPRAALQPLDAFSSSSLRSLQHPWAGAATASPPPADCETMAVESQVSVLPAAPEASGSITAASARAIGTSEASTASSLALSAVHCALGWAERGELVQPGSVTIHEVGLAAPTGRRRGYLQ